MAKDAQKVMERWSRNLTNNIDKFKDGVAAVQESPGVTAAEHIDDYRAGVLAALESGKTAEAMRSVKLPDWQQATSGRGATNLQTAAADTQVKNKVKRALDVILPFTENVKATIRRMPKGTKAERKARMNKAFDMMSELKVPKG